MLRRLIASTILIPVMLAAAVWPDAVGTFKKTSPRPVVVSERALWEEYGFQEAESAEYRYGNQRLIATAWRFNDPTGAFAAFQWQCTPNARSSALSRHAAETDDAAWLAFGNYLLHFSGWKPSVGEIAPVLNALPLLNQSSLPALASYLPAENLVPNSSRFILGPVSLEKFKPGIPPAVAAFHFGTEAQVARYRSPAGEIELALFSYPTPQIARGRAAEFEKLSGAIVKRSGPLLAVIISPRDPNYAEKILAKIRYQASVSWSEYVPTRRDNVGDLILTAFLMVGWLLVFAAASGLAFAGLRILVRAVQGRERADDPMIRLRLEDR